MPCLTSAGSELGTTIFIGVSILVPAGVFKIACKIACEVWSGTLYVLVGSISTTGLAPKNHSSSGSGILPDVMLSKCHLIARLYPYNKFLRGTSPQN